MTLDILAAADAVSDQDLLARLEALASTERRACAELIAHLAVLETRPSLYAARGFGSLFEYCTQALRLSEDAASNRIAVTRTCRRFPVILERLARGSLSLTSIRMLGPHLTGENFTGVVERASHRTLHEIAGLVAELAPKPDVRTSVRKVPVRIPAPPPAAPAALEIPAAVVSPSVTSAGDKVETPTPFLTPPPRPVIKATAPGRYRTQFMMSEEMHARLRRVQDLLRREIPSGDAAQIFDRALAVLERELEKKKFGASDRPRIRRETDHSPRKSALPSRHIPNAVKRVVRSRDEGQCTFVSPDGRRCGQRAFLDFHHVDPYANGGPATVENITLRCRLCRARHKRHYAESRIMPSRCIQAGKDAVVSEARSA